MIKIDGLREVIAQIKSERGIPEDEIMGAISDALVLAAKRYYGVSDNLKAILDLDNSNAMIMATMKVVKTVTDPKTEITTKEAKKLRSTAKLGEEVDMEIHPPDFGRIAAQKAKQVITQRIIEAEKKSIMSEYQDKIGNLITGIVQRIEGSNYLINLGRTEAVLDYRNQIPDETYRLKDRIKLYLVDIARTNRGPEVVVSRSHEGLVKKMFELEVPEIAEGVIEIKAIARKAGYRTKIAVHSNSAEVGAVGTCVGRMGARIQAVLKEINGEKIDIIEWKEDTCELIANALKPATIYRVEIVDKDEKRAKAIVEDDQLSLAIGKTGLNVRLASKLTGWNIDVVKKSEVEANLLDKLMAEKKSNATKKETEIKVEEKKVEKDEKKKIRVNEAASELGMNTDEFIKKVEEQGHKVKSATSNIDYDLYMKIKETIA
ncbi:MAG: transcription termination factor NusA [Candidatus Margulisbacteria bacterium]|nr:transcription termination factor NusA [Candidatus Margulisiibacteriota bacterium]